MYCRILLSLALCCLSVWVRPAAAASSAEKVSPCKLPARAGVDLSEGFGSNGLHCAPSVGVLNAFMLFVDFPDSPAPAAETPQSLYDVFLPEAAQWYANSSYGQLSLNITADTSRFYRMPARAASYGWQRGLTAEAHYKYIQDAIEAYSSGNASRAVPAADVLYVVPTKAARAISFSPTYMNDVRARGGGGERVAVKAVTFGLDAYESWHFKVLNHETGHTMCLPDLYPEGRPTGLWVGGWDMMGYINGPSPDYFAWHKWKLGWLSDEQVGCVAEKGSSTHTLSPIEVASVPAGGKNGTGEEGGDGSVKAVVFKHNDTAALVAEVRSKLGGDSAACSTGVLLYTVSTTLASQQGSIKVLDATPKSGGCAGEELNDAPLTLSGTKSYRVAEWGVEVSIVETKGDSFVIKVDSS